MFWQFGGLDPSSVGLSHEERFSEIIKEYEQQCRVRPTALNRLAFILKGTDDFAERICLKHISCTHLSTGVVMRQQSAGLNLSCEVLDYVSSQPIKRRQAANVNTEAVWRPQQVKAFQEMDDRKSFQIKM